MVMAETEDDLHGIASRLAEDECATTMFPHPGDPQEHEEEAMRQQEREEQEDEQRQLMVHHDSPFHGCCNHCFK